MSNIVVRVMKPSEMELAMRWAEREGWNPGLDDEACFYGADPDGFFVGEVDGKIVSMVSAVKYDNNYGFIGFYIVDPKHRSKGYGLQVWNAAMDYLSGRKIGLDAVPIQVENYSKSGFVFAHENITFKGVSKFIDQKTDEIAELSLPDFSIIREYDKRFHPDSRDVFLKCWISQEHSTLAGFFDGDYLTGYGKIRQCKNGFKIGPLFAENKDVAKELLIWLQNKIPEGQEFTLDIPITNPDALKMAEEFDMEYFSETVRMYLGPIPNLNIKKIFGLTSTELG